MAQRYTLQPAYNTSDGYAVWDKKARTVALWRKTKSEAIVEAQRLNNYTPVNGDWQTFTRQSKEDTNA